MSLSIESSSSLFLFGFLVFLSQASLLTNLIRYTAIERLPSNVSEDGTHKFLPANVDPVFKIAQSVAILSVVLLFDKKVEDILSGIDLLGTIHGPWMLLASTLSFLDIMKTGGQLNVAMI